MENIIQNGGFWGENPLFSETSYLAAEVQDANILPFGSLSRKRFHSKSLVNSTNGPLPNRNFFNKEKQFKS